MRYRVNYEARGSGWVRGGGTPGNSWWGCAEKNVILPIRFQTRPPKSIPVFRPGLKAKITS